MIVVAHVIVSGSVHQLEKWYPVSAVGVTVVVPILNVWSSFSTTATPYGTFVIVAGSVCPYVSSLTVIVTVYLFTSLSNCALKSVFLVIGHTVGFHPLNV